ncbi:glycosyltransferase family 2 protein [Streptomyces sp. NPDC056160]|uniref:glycosyltransferase family 2 protein n=1 Tax=Streptomyces sp. NPDC056160 TaxID=3345731 RepID=UPI0035D9DC8F
MRGGIEDGRLWWQRAVARGFDPAPAPDGPVALVRDGLVLPGHDALTALPTGGLGVLLPTYVARCGLDEQRTALRHLLDALAEVRASRPGLPLTLWLGMQYGPGELGEAVRRLRALTGTAARAEGAGTAAAADGAGPTASADGAGTDASVDGVETGTSVDAACTTPAGAAGALPADVVGFALPGPGKIRTVNAALRLSRPLGHTGWLWTDDDVHLAPGCLARLVARFQERGATGAVGAHLAALPRASAAARTMDRVSRVTTPPAPCPAAACMLVAAPVLAGGIPARRLADDGHVLFELLDPAAPDPWHDLEVLSEARGSFYRVGRSHDTLRRLRRSLYSHVTCTADYPWPVARLYLTGVLFHGLWPLAPWNGAGGWARGAKRWTVKAVQAAWFCSVAAGLAGRGLLGRPLRHVPWGDEGDFRSPAAEGRPTAVAAAQR